LTQNTFLSRPISLCIDATIYSERLASRMPMRGMPGFAFIAHIRAAYQYMGWIEELCLTQDTFLSRPISPCIDAIIYSEQLTFHD
jgi:hypothetical protein